MKAQIGSIFRFAALCSLFGGCASSRPSVVIPTEVPTVRHGILAGYLKNEDLPNSLAILPPPPAEKTAAFAGDEDAFKKTRALKDTPRWKQAIEDADLKFPKAAQNFSCALDVPISEKETPHLYMLMRRTLADGALSTYKAKEHYKRTRPFVFNNTSSCTPSDEPFLKKDGSYPSGHSAAGWTWALVLSQVAPERTNELLARGLAYGQSRVICGVHWQSDVTQGRVVAAGAVARLQSDPIFQAELEAAKKEVSNLRTQGQKPTRDCKAEAEALGV